ncbi:MAG: hypothetical protein ACI9KE_001451 [Polyangiales bacterium]|jgi:hypothetical protein
MEANMNNHQNSILNKVSSFMRTSLMRPRVSSILILALAASFAACTQGQGEINRVQTNLVSKDLFVGEWWVNQTVLDADAEASFEGPGYSLYAGGSGWTDYAVDRGQSPTLARIRWVIDEDFLYAYRSYEIIDGGNDDGNDVDFRGQPIAAYAIENHVDVRTQYSGVTGEQTNVIEENTADQRWYERPYMRVDWSMNHVNSFSFLIDDVTMGGAWQQESVPFFIPDADSHNDFPNRYAPQFVRIGEDDDYRFRHEWPEGTEDTIHYMSFTTMSLFSPGQSCLLIGGGRCNTISVPLRTAFLRIPPEHTFASQTQSHDQFDRFGLFRSYQRSYIRGGVREIACENDGDCGSNGYCRPEEQLCSGLSADYGETDFLTFMRPVHNIWRGGLTDTTCGADFQCAEAGSECDLSALRCTIPLNQRERNPVVYHLNEGYPAYLVKSAFEVMGNWNEVFMRGWRAANNEALPDYTTGTMTCQNENPTAYCACGSADDVGGSCKTEFNPFISPAEWASMGVTDAFDCYAVNENGAAVDPASPQSFGDYPIPATYEYEFVGTECTFYLESNNCDLYRTDVNQTCEDVMAADGNEEFTSWQQHGDLRYQFFNYIHQNGVPFGGLSEVRGDVKTGELLASDANVNSGSIDSVRTIAIEWFPVLRCSGPGGCAPGEENADVRYLEGENVRDYFDNLGRTEVPVSISPSGSDGTGDGEGGRPELPAGATRGIPAGSAMIDGMLQTVVDQMPRIEQLNGQDSRFNIYSDRMRNLAGTSIESSMLESLGGQAMQANFRNTPLNTTTVANDADVMDPAVLDQISPFRGQNFISQLNARAEFEERMGNHNACFTDSVDGQDFQRSRYWEYWAEAFRGRTKEEASIRMAQQYLRAVQHHEIGHSVGLRHNFAGSLDRNNYGDGYFNLTVGEGIELPELEDYDLPENGGDGDFFVGGDEVTNFQNDLNDVRDQRAARGAHNYMTASIMDYNGDTSDSYGLGRYDQAAILWSTFGKVEAYNQDPRISSTGSNNELHARFDATTGNVVERTLWTSYEGGESCDADAQCPYTVTSSLLSNDQPVYQRCIRHPRNTRFQQECGDGEADCICSNFDRDFDDYRAQVAYDSDVDGDGELDHFPVNYLFCSDGRTGDISWCTRSDVGESFQETLAHYRRSWYESYANGYNRRFRGAYSGWSVRPVTQAVKIYQHLFFRIFFEPGFTSNEGPLGFRDQFAASVDAMNWFIELINLPDEGSYEMNPDTNVLELVSSEPGMAGADVSMDQGLGFGMWSEFQEGHVGFSRTERAGVFYDKFFALYALANRDWNLNFSIDEAYRINFYDLFEVPMTEFFGGIITDQPSWFAPRYDMNTGEVEHMTWYRGLLLGECGSTGARVPCRPSNEIEYAVTADRPAIGNTTNVILRSWATILALAQFPVFYDASFEQRLIVWRQGDGVGHRLPAVSRDRRTGVERPYCSFGAAIDAGHVEVGDATCATEADANYVVFQSDRLHFAYVAEKVFTRDAFNLEEEQLGFQMLSRLIRVQEEVRALALAGPSPELTSKREELFENESYLEYLIDLQDQYGIGSAGW